MKIRRNLEFEFFDDYNSFSILRMRESKKWETRHHFLTRIARSVVTVLPKVPYQPIHRSSRIEVSFKHV